MIKRVLLFSFLSVCIISAPAYALTYNSYGDPNAGGVNIFNNYTFKSDEDWVAEANSPVTEGMYKFRAVGESADDLRARPYTSNGDLILPVSSDRISYEVPLHPGELVSLMKSTKDDPPSMMLKINIWYEPADSQNYDADIHYRLFDLKAYGLYRCKSCGAEREDYLVRVYQEERRCPWDSFAIPAQAQPLYITDGDGTEKLNYSTKYKSVRLIDQRVCPGDECHKTMYLKAAWLRLSPTPLDYEGIEYEEFDESGLLPAEKIGKIHIRYFAIERAISGYTWVEDEGVGQRQVMIHDASITKTADGYSFSAKALNMRYDRKWYEAYGGASFHPVILICGYKNGRLVKTVVKDASEYRDLWIYSSASQMIYNKHYSGSIDGYRGENLTVSLSDGDYDEVKAFIWEGVDNLIPYVMTTLKLD